MARGLEDPRKRGSFLAWMIAFAIGMPIIYGIYLVVDRIGIVPAAALAVLLSLGGVLLMHRKL
jgi:hypothetical protein